MGIGCPLISLPHINMVEKHTGTKGSRNITQHKTRDHGEKQSLPSACYFQPKWQRNDDAVQSVVWLSSD